jgi:hypothetical protein
MAQIKIGGGVFPAPLFYVHCRERPPAHQRLNRDGILLESEREAREATMPASAMRYLFEGAERVGRFYELAGNAVEAKGWRAKRDADMRRGVRKSVRDEIRPNSELCRAWDGSGPG